jgi:hypothetical protein
MLSCPGDKQGKAVIRRVLNASLEDEKGQPLLLGSWPGAHDWAVLFFIRQE